MAEMQEKNISYPQHIEYMALIARHGQFLTIFFLSAVITALALTYVFSEKYQSTSMVFYRNQEVTLLNQKEMEAFGSQAPSTPFKVVSKTIQELVESEIILRPVVLALNLHIENRSYEGAWYIQWYERSKDWLKDLKSDISSLLKYGRFIDQDPVAFAIKSLANNVTVINKDSYVFAIRVRDKHQERVALIADKIGSQLVDFLLAEARNSGEIKQQQTGKLLDAKIYEVSSLHNQIQALLEDNSIASVEEEISRAMERWSALELERVDLLANISQSRQQIAAIQSSLSNENESNRKLRPEDKKRLESDELFTEVELAGMLNRYYSLQASLAELSKRLDTLPTVQLQLQQLSSDLDFAKRDEAELRDAYQEAVFRATQGSGEASVMNTAAVPSAPVAPIKIYHVLLAGFLSLLVGISVIFVLNYFNIRLLFKSQGTRGRSRSSGGKGKGGDNRQAKQEKIQETSR